jgi:hypothetical protein
MRRTLFEFVGPHPGKTDMKHQRGSLCYTTNSDKRGRTLWRPETKAYSDWPSVALGECGRDRGGTMGGVLLVAFSVFSNKYVGTRTFFEASIDPRQVQSLPKEVEALVAPKQPAWRFQIALRNSFSSVSWLELVKTNQGRESWSTSNLGRTGGAQLHQDSTLENSQKR